MATPRVITTTTDLVKYVKNILGDKWSVDAGESTRVEIGRAFGLRKHHYWHLTVDCDEPVKIRVFLCANTFPALVKTTERDLWEKIREKFEEASVQWQRPGQPEVIENKGRRLGVKRPAIEHKQAALPHQPALLTHRPKQLLLPAPPEEPQCNWPGCTATISPKAWACTSHWQALPSVYREQIIDLYRPGETQSAEFLAYTNDLKAQIKRYPALFKIKD